MNHDSDTRDLLGNDAHVRCAELRSLARRDALAAFEGSLEFLRHLVLIAASAPDDGDPRKSRFAEPALVTRSLIARLLREDAKRREHEIDRESAWYVLFDLWLDDDGGLLDGFSAFLAKAAILAADRRVLRRLATAELGDLPLVFPLGAADDLRRVVLVAARGRLESFLAALAEGDADAVMAGSPGKPDVRESRRAARRALETEFLREPTEARFLAIRAVVPKEQWGAVRERLLGHLQKHQREPSLVFKLYLDEGLLVDADGVVVTQPVDPDVLAGAAMDLKERDPVVAAGWLLTAACRLADSFPKSRWHDVVRHLVLVRDLAAHQDGGDAFHRVLRAFRFRHAASPDLLSRLAEVGL